MQVDQHKKMPSGLCILLLVPPMRSDAIYSYHWEDFRDIFFIRGAEPSILSECSMLEEWSGWQSPILSIIFRAADGRHKRGKNVWLYRNMILAYGIPHRIAVIPNTRGSNRSLPRKGCYEHSSVPHCN